MSKRTTSRGKEVFKQCVAPKRPGNQHKAMPGKLTIPSMVLFSLFLMSAGSVWAACPDGSTFNSSIGACVYPAQTTTSQSTTPSVASDFSVDSDTVVLVGNGKTATDANITVNNGTLQLGLGTSDDVNRGGELKSVTLNDSTLKVSTVFYEGKVVIDGTDAHGFEIYGLTDTAASKVLINKDANLVIKNSNADGINQVNSSIDNYGNLYFWTGQLELTNTFINHESGAFETYSPLIISKSDSGTAEFINNGKIKTNKNVLIQRDVQIGSTGSFYSYYYDSDNTDQTLGIHVTQSTLNNEGGVFGRTLFVESGGTVNVKSGGFLYLEKLNTIDDGVLNLEDGATFVAETLDAGTKIVRTGSGKTASLYLGYKATSLYNETNNTRADEAYYFKIESPYLSYLVGQYTSYARICYSCQAPDTTMDSGFGVTTPGGEIGALDVYSGISAANPTWVIGSNTTVLNGGLMQTYDAGYLLEPTTVTIQEGGKVEVLTFIGTYDGKNCDELGSFVINGSVVNNGTFDASNGYEVYIGPTGSFISSGSNSRSEFNLLIVDGGSMGVKDGASMTVQELGSDDDSSMGKLTVAGQDTTVTVATPSISNFDITVTPGAFLGLGITKEDAKATGYVDKNKAVLALNPDQSLDISKSIVRVGSVPENQTLETGDLYFAKDSVFIVDLASVAEDSALLTGDPDKNGSIYVEKGAQLVVNTYSYGKTQLTANLTPVMEEDAWEGEDLINGTTDSLSISLDRDDGNLYLTVAKASKQKSEPEKDPVIQGLSKDYSLPGVINGLIDTDEGALLRVTNADKADIQLINRLLSPTYFGNDQGEIDVQWSSNVWNSVSSIGAVSGVNAYSLDMNRQITDAIEAHTEANADKTLNRNLWVQLLGNTSQADSLKSELPSKIGYKAKSYGFIFGADVLNSYDALVGMAFNYVKGDLDSKGNYVKTDSDAKIWGLNIYGSRQFGAAKVSALFSYQSSSGKASQSFTDLLGNGYAVRSDLDSKSIVFGIRGEYAFDLGKALVIPHAGLRYSYTNFDNSAVNINGEKAFNVSTKNKGIFSMPMGVALEGKVQAGDWNVKPGVDLSLVPQLGSKPTRATVSAENFNGVDSTSYNVTGNFMGEMVLGLEAQNKAHSFLIFYKGALGDQGRSSHSLNAGYRFSF